MYVCMAQGSNRECNSPLLEEEASCRGTRTVEMEHARWRCTYTYLLRV